ncbi:unnamed protein product [Ectocarpus fasciculatus]
MSGHIVPKRFGLKYSPKPAIALEYQKPDAGIAIVEVQIEQLSPKTFDVSGVVDALQKKHPCHLGPDMVSVHQLERLVSRLLSEGRAHLPGEYPTTPEQMVVNEPHHQSSSTTPQKHGHPTQPLSLPKSEGYDSDNSGHLSTEPTPAPTPEVPRLTRDLSEDGGIATSYAPLSPQGTSFHGVGIEEGKHDGDVADAKQEQTSGDRGGEDKQTSTAMVGGTGAAATADAAAATGSSVEEAKSSQVREDEEKREEDSLSQRGGDDDQSRVEQEVSKDNDERGLDVQAVSRVGASKAEEETTAGETDTKLIEQREDPEKWDHIINDYADPKREGRHGVGEDNIEGHSSSHTSEGSHVATAAVAATHVEEKTNQESSRVEPGPGGSGSGKIEGEEEEEDIPEIGEDIVDGIEIEGFEEGAGDSNRVDARDGEESEDGRVNRTKSNSEDSERADDTGGTPDSAVAAVASVGDTETTPERAETGDASGDAVVSNDAKKVAEDFDDDDDDDDAVDDTPPGRDTRSSFTSLLKGRTEAAAGTTFTPTYSENEHPAVEERRHEDQNTSSEDDVVSASKTTEREPGEMGAAEPPGAPPPPSPPLPSASNEGGTLSSLSSPLASPRGLAPLSSLAGLPPPPMGGARQRLGLLGALPPVGGRGLPSLVLPGGLKASSSAPGQEREDDARKEGGGGIDDSATRGTTEAGGLSDRTSTPPSPSSSGKHQSVSAAAARSSATKEGSASNVGSPTHASAGKRDDDRDDEHNGPGRLSTGGDVKEQEETKDDAEAALRARLGLGDDDDDGGGGSDNSTLSPPDSPKQHQGQEEEDAGRALLAGLGGKVGGGTATEVTPAAPAGGREGGGYFGGSDEEVSEAEIDGEVSSVGEDMSFEQESVESGGDDDYFS